MHAVDYLLPVLCTQHICIYTYINTAYIYFLYVFNVVIPVHSSLMFMLILSILLSLFLAVCVKFLVCAHIHDQ